MQVSVESTSALERQMTVAIPADRIDSEVDTRLKKASKTVRLDGFRQGKVPMKVIRQRFGAGVRQEVLNELMGQTYYEAITEQKLMPAGQPSIEPKSLEEGKDVEYIATFEVYPEISLNSLEGVQVEKPVADVTDADVDEMINTFRDQQGKFSEVERAAAQGDQVNIDYKGFKDGEAFDGGTAEGTPLVIGSGRMIPGFEDGIVGMKAGDEKSLELTFPEEYHSEDLKGAAVTFEIKVNSVSEKQPAELNDDFFALYGVSEGGEEAFKTEIRNNMERELKQAINNKVKTQVMDALLEKHSDVAVPSALTSQEINVLRQQAFQQFGAAAQQLDASILPDELFKEQAERRVQLGLILGEFIKANEIKAEADKVRAFIEEMASTYQDPQEVINYYYQNQDQMRQVESAVLEETAVEKLLEQVKVEEKNVSYQEALKPLPQNKADAEAEDE